MFFKAPHTAQQLYKGSKVTGGSSQSSRNQAGHPAAHWAVLGGRGGLKRQASKAGAHPSRVRPNPTKVFVVVVILSTTGCNVV